MGGADWTGHADSPHLHILVVALYISDDLKQKLYGHALALISGRPITPTTRAAGKCPARALQFLGRLLVLVIGQLRLDLQGGNFGRQLKIVHLLYN